jgi:hypothetical protein
MIIRRVLRSSNRRNDIYHRLICGLSCSDVISSTAYFLGTWLVPSREIGDFGPVYGAVGNHATCSLSGFLTQMTIASPLYNGSLSLYYLLTINYNWPDERIKKIEKWLHILPLGYALLSSSIALGLDMYGNVEWLCWIKPDVEDDDDDGGGRAAVPTNAQKNFVIFQWVFLFGPLWVTILFVSLVFYVLYRKVKENEKRMEKYKFSLTTSSGGSCGGGGAISTTATATSTAGIHGLADGVAEDDHGSTPAVSHPRLSLFGASLKQQKKKEKIHRYHDDDDLVEAMEKQKDDCGMVGNYRLLMTADTKTSYYRKNKSNSSGSSSSLLHDDGWRALRKKSHNYEVDDKSKQDQRTHHQQQEQTIMVVKNGDDLEVKEQEKKSPTSHSSCHEQNTKNSSAMKDDDDDDDVDQHVHCNSKVSDFHGDGEEEEEEEGETQLTLDEEMAIKYAANATMMKQNNNTSGTHHYKTVPDGGDEDELLSASDGNGKRKSVTFSSRTMMVQKASISSNHSVRASFRSQLSLPASDRSSQSSIMGLSMSALNKKKKKWYEKASKSRQIAIQGILYSCAFYFTWFFPTLQRITELAVNTNYYVIQFLDSFLLPLQGAFNFAIYIRPRFIAFQSSNPQAGFWRTLREVTCDNS